jgi:hypothetical protein
MGIESLLIIACVFGNGNSCTTSAQAYYLTTDLPDYVASIEREHKQAVYAATLLATALERKASVGIGYNLVASMDFTSGTGAPYLKWVWGF